MTNQTVSNNSQKNNQKPSIFDGFHGIPVKKEKSVSNNNQKNNQKPSIFDGLGGIPVENVSPASSQEKSVVDNLSPTGKESLTTQRVEVPVIVYKDKFSPDFAIGIVFGVLITFVAIFAARKMFRN